MACVRLKSDGRILTISNYRECLADEIRLKRVPTHLAGQSAAAPQDFRRHTSGVQWYSRHLPLVARTIRGLKRHWTLD
jgi:hypothetical protein